MLTPLLSHTLSLSCFSLSCFFLSLSQVASQAVQMLSRNDRFKKSDPQGLGITAVRLY